MPKATEFRLQTLTGPAILPYLSALAVLRVEVFRDWPYIYDGSAAYEETYMLSYAAATRAAVIAAFDGETVIGAATCLPLADQPARIQLPLIRAGLTVAQIFYFGESVLQKAYRGRGIGIGFFNAREAHARSFGIYTTTAFCAVERPATHPLKSADFIPLDAFWTKRGYTKRPGIQCEMSWRDLDETSETSKKLTFWTKKL